MQASYNVTGGAAPAGSGLNVRLRINQAFSAVMSQNSGDTEPTETIAGMWWWDTLTGFLKQRNVTDDGWNTRWDMTKGQLATLFSPTFAGEVNLPTTTYIGGYTVARTTAPVFTGNSVFETLTAWSSVSLPASTTIGGVSPTELSYLDGVTSAIQTQLNTLSSGKANLASPIFTGSVVVPTGAGNTNAVNKGQMDSAISNAIANIPSTVEISNLAPYAAGSYIVANSSAIENTLSKSYVKIKEIWVPRSGTITTYFGLAIQGGAITAYGRVYVNGVAVGTQRSNASTTWAYFTENITVNAGDFVQLYCKSNSATYGTSIQSFQIRVSNPHIEIVFS